MNIKNSICFRIENLKNRVSENRATYRAFKHRDEIILSDFSRKTKRNCMNIHYWKPKDGNENLGDYLSKIVVSNFVNLDAEYEVEGGNKHLYAIGSIIGFGCQDAVIWGSGILNDYRLYRDRIRKSSLDIRCVRGQKTRMLLRSYGVKCPEVYGDPAILLPEIYMPKNDKKLYDVSVITHFSKNNLEYKGIHRINMLITDYKSVVDEIVAFKLVISSSLHGIILSEIYGVPCVLLSENNMNLFKYEDYYYSTERYNIPKAGNIEEALNLKPLNIPDFTNIRENLRNSFSYDCACLFK